jgi:formamidase
VRFSWGGARPRPEQIVAGLYVTSMFVVFLDQTVVTVALPTLARTFHTSSSSASQVVAVYLVSMGIAISTASWLDDVLGVRRTFVAALALFTLASVCCGVAQSHGQLVIYRAIQGIGAGVLVPTGLTMFFRAYAPERRIGMVRVLVTPIACAPMVGPIVGGLFTTDLSWRWIFYINLPIGLAALLVALLALPRDAPATVRHRFDIPGFILAGASCGLILLALSRTATAGWTSPSVLLEVGIGVLALAVFVWVELRSAQPLLDLNVMRGRLFGLVNAANVFAIAMFAAILFLVPLFIQLAQGRSALSAGLTTCFEPVGALTFSQLVGRLYHRFGPRRLVSVALVVLVGLLALYQTLDAGTNLWAIRILMFATGCCAVTIYQSTQVAAFAQVEDTQISDATTIFSMSRQLAAALSVAVVASLLGFDSAPVGAGSPNAGLVGAFHHGFLVAGVCAVAALALAVRISDSDAASTRLDLEPVGRRRDVRRSARRGTGSPGTPLSPIPPNREARSAMKGISIDRTKMLKDQPETGHNRWHPDITPVIEVEPGEDVFIETRDATDGQMTKASVPADIPGWDQHVAHPMTGPVYVKGAEPGDLLEIETLDIVSEPYGWTMAAPIGFLPGLIDEFFFFHWDIDGDWATSEQLPGVRIPGGPFMGCVGVAPSHTLLAEWARREDAIPDQDGIVPRTTEGAVPATGPIASDGARTIPPRENYGNLDAKQLTTGSHLFLPVFVDGALFSSGDAHYAQGDNECSLSAIEMSATHVVRFHLHKGDAERRNIRWPRLSHPGFFGKPEWTAPSNFTATFGMPVNEDGSNEKENITLAARNALYQMIELLEERGWTKAEAQVICSVAVDLRISNAVDLPNVTVAALLPEGIFVDA